MDLTLGFNNLKKEHALNPYPSVKERKQVLRVLKKGLKTKATSLAQAVNRDFGHRPEEETLFLEIFPTLQALHYCSKQMKGWMKEQKRRVSWLLFPAYAAVLPQPLGVVGIIVPWNYPIFLSLIPAIYAVAAGNRVMIKMSDLSAHSGSALAAFIHSLGLDKYILVVNGDGELAKEFAALPFNHLLFTGSSEVGKKVMAAASQHLTPVTLELGGKSPAVVSKTMNEAYFNRLVIGKLFNAAQTCIAPDYLFIPTGWEKKVEQMLHYHVEQLYPQAEHNAQYTSIISTQHQQRLNDLVADARQKGARVVLVGDRRQMRNKMPLHVLFEVTPDMRVMQEELFGPILPVVTYTAFTDVIQKINAAPNPLALYYFGHDKQEIAGLKTQTLSGALTINDTLVHVAVDDLPFGGVGNSGMGQYHGREGFNTFSQLKTIMVQRRFSPMTWLYPPYGHFMQLFLKWVAGIKLGTTK